MVKFFCDRCGAEVEQLDELLDFSLEVNERPNHSIWNWRAEVCRGCYELLKEELHQRLIAPATVEESRKKAVRKVVS
ncbi:MAG: hypothetical protein HYZ50_05380 [Deltaproteobacteria bacterium]|nr:hypothetical protein [Deltaproteobacteria bacterium]